MKSEKLIIMLATALILSGCSVPKSSFVITVPQNTKIEWKEQEQTNNDIKITVPANEYVGFLVATDPRAGLRVPFGVDYKRKVYNGDGVMTGFGIATATGGAVLSLAGLCLAKTDGDLAVGIGLPGLATVAGGMLLTTSGVQHNNLVSHDYKFTYVPRQRISFDVISPILAHVDPPKETPTDTPLHTSKSTGSSYRTKTPSKSSTSSKNKKYLPTDNAEQISGTYSGTLKIMEGQETVESYSKASVELLKIDKSKVKVTIKIRGENFYDEDDVDMIATIIPEKNGNYILKLESNSDAIIKVTKTKALSITQKIYGPNGEQAVLSFTGNK